MKKYLIMKFTPKLIGWKKSEIEVYKVDLEKSKFSAEILVDYFVKKKMADGWYPLELKVIEK